MSQTSLKTSFRVETKVAAFYTGGKVQFSSNGEYCFCSCGCKIQIISTKTGRIWKSLQEDEDDISSFVLSNDDEILITASRSIMLRQWDWKNEKVTRKWKGLHSSPIVCMAFDPTSTLLATGSADSTIKVWDIVKQYCTHNFRGSQGVVHLVQFHPDPEKVVLYSSSSDSNIKLWDLVSSRCIATLTGHYSHVTSLSFVDDNQKLISGSRDKVVIFWDLATRKSIKTIPVYESIESVVALSANENFQWHEGQNGGENTVFITTGEKGKIRAWKFPSGKCIFTEETPSLCIQGHEESDVAPNMPGIVQCFPNEALDCLVTVTDEHNIILRELSTLKVMKQFVGHYDEILDLAFVGENDSMLSVASNSPGIKIIDIDTLDCRILTGHSDTVMSLDSSYDLQYIASCSKDNTARIWKMGEDKVFVCVAVAVGHTHAVGTVSWAKNSTDYLVTGSQDLTIKYWKLPLLFEERKLLRIPAVWTTLAHDKNINSVAFSPNDKFIASGSQDKTAKLWLTSDGSLYGTLRGHKRGIWCVVFSPVDKCLATASADSTIKIWAIQDLTCVKTFEGHTNSVLKLCFMTRGMQIVSSGSDGLVKVWNVKTSECVKTLDEHVDKVWSLALNKAEDMLVTGGGDSVLNLWKDVTEEELLIEESKQEELILKDQELSNLLELRQYAKAIGLALTLDRPFRALSILKDLLEEEHGKKQIEKVIEEFRDDQIDSLLRFMRDWNTNARHCYATQTVLATILKSKSPDDLAELADMRESIEALLPYTERHFNRMDRLLQQSTFLDYTWESMKLSIIDVDVEALPVVKGTTSCSRTHSSATEDPEIVSSSTTMAPVTTLHEEASFSDCREVAPGDNSEPADISSVGGIRESNPEINETKQDENKENEKTEDIETTKGSLDIAKGKKKRRKFSRNSSTSSKHSSKKAKAASS